MPSKSAFFVVVLLALALLSTQLHASSLCSYFNYQIQASQVLPPTTSLMSGWSEAHLCDDGSFSGYVWWSGSETVTSVHLHGPSGPNETGDLFYDFPLLQPLGDRVDFDIESFPVEAIPWLTNEQGYIDVHTVEHPNGAIRGVVHAEISVDQSAWSNVKRLFR